MLFRRRRVVAVTLGVLLMAALGVVGLGYANALEDPVIRRAHVVVVDWPPGEPTRRVMALSDIHVAGPDMPPERLERIISGLNALRPDLVVIAGDLISERRGATRLYSADEIVSALATLRAPLGVVIAPGNHDHWAGIKPFEVASARAGLAMIRNGSTARGPFRLSVIDDDYSGHADPARAMSGLDKLRPGVPLMLTHSPDVIPEVEHDFAAIFAGHTHCGQIRLPLVGAIATMSRHGNRFACGQIKDEGRTIFVGAGLGTSLLPLRFGTPPDVWLVTFGPAPAGAKAQ